MEIAVFNFIMYLFLAIMLVFVGVLLWLRVTNSSSYDKTESTESKVEPDVLPTLPDAALKGDDDFEGDHHFTYGVGKDLDDDIFIYGAH